MKKYVYYVKRLIKFPRYSSRVFVREGGKSGCLVNWERRLAQAAKRSPGRNSESGSETFGL
jgi:hypothetical protein